jgi:hypothetical protein
VLSLDHQERQRWVEEIGKINRKLSQEGEKSDYDEWAAY